MTAPHAAYASVAYVLGILLVVTVVRALIIRNAIKRAGEDGLNENTQGQSLNHGEGE